MILYPLIADDTIDESCCFRKDKDEGDRRPGEDGWVVGLNEVEAGVVSSSELLRSLRDILVYCEYDSEGIFCVVRQINVYDFEGSTFEGEEF